MTEVDLAASDDSNIGNASAVNETPQSGQAAGESGQASGAENGQTTATIGDFIEWLHEDTEERVSATSMCHILPRINLYVGTCVLTESTRFVLPL